MKHPLQICPRLGQLDFGRYYAESAIPWKTSSYTWCLHQISPLRAHGTLWKVHCKIQREWRIQIKKALQISIVKVTWIHSLRQHTCIGPHSLHQFLNIYYGLQFSGFYGTLEGMSKWVSDLQGSFLLFSLLDPNVLVIVISYFTLLFKKKYDILRYTPSFQAHKINNLKLLICVIGYLIHAK